MDPNERLEYLLLIKDGRVSHIDTHTYFFYWTYTELPLAPNEIMLSRNVLPTRPTDQHIKVSPD